MANASKRAFPYYTAVEGLELKRQAIEGVNPGAERAAPRVFEPALLNEAQRDDAGGTDFTGWTVEQLRLPDQVHRQQHGHADDSMRLRQAFLDQRGEDYDDWFDKDALVVKAQECEINTGKAPSPSREHTQGVGDDDEDALDAFMAGIQTEVAENRAPEKKPPKPEEELDEYDAVADYMEAQQRRRSAVAYTAASGAGRVDYNSDEEVYNMARAVDEAGGLVFDADGNQVIAGEADVRKIEPLPPINHDDMDYDEFAKDLYEPTDEVLTMMEAQVNEARRQLGLRVSGFDVPRPVQSFEQCSFDNVITVALKRAGFAKPTAIQAQALPAAMSGRDVVGIAETGSGKTAAFILPMLVHIMDQPELAEGEGPIAVIMAPTRELAEQIHREARRFSKGYGLRVCAAFGGLEKRNQVKDLKAGSEVAVCTPGRMIDLIKMKACTLRRTTFVVLDEADRMLDMGFEPQVRSLLGQIRPDRQTLLFSATMPRKVESLVRDAVSEPVRITVGGAGANEDIRQVVEVVPVAEKLAWLLGHLPGFIDAGDVLVFANQKAQVDELTAKIQAAGFRAAAIHGDMDQHTRMTTLGDFKEGRHHVLVATDVAARGLDIRSIKSVVNYDAAKDVDTHVHRIGRTGRAGDKDGTAYTLVAPNQNRVAVDLVHLLTMAHQELPPALVSLAKKDGRFRQGAGRGRGGGGRGRGGRRRQVGGAGLGFQAEDADAAPQPPTLTTASGNPSEAKMGFAAANEADHFSSISTTAPPVIQRSAQAVTAYGVDAPAAFDASSSGGATWNPSAPGAAAAAAVAARLIAMAAAGAANTDAPPQKTLLLQPSKHAAQAGGQAGGLLPPPPAQPPQAAQQRQETVPAQVPSLEPRNPYAQRFKSSFVPSGTTAGDSSVRATVVMPRQAPGQRTAAPAPVPLSQIPLYLQRQMPGFNMPVVTSRDSAAVQEAIAAAKAAAARLGVSSAAAGGAAGLQRAHYPPHQRPVAAQSAATWRDLLDGDRTTAAGNGSSRRDRWDQKSR